MALAYKVEYGLDRPDYHDVWLIWSAAFLLPWSVLFVVRLRLRRHMIWASVLTMLGLTEPLFVPACWYPPSLFDLAQRIGFGIESLIFAFAIGALATAAYDQLTHGPIDQPNNKAPLASRHLCHR